MKRNEFEYEKSIIARLAAFFPGLRPTRGSGNQWHSPEDAENGAVLMQIKSTQTKSSTLKEQDVLDLQQHAEVAHKLPVFVLDLKGMTFICVRVEYLERFFALIRKGVQ